MCKGGSLVNHIGGRVDYKDWESYGEWSRLWYEKLFEYGWGHSQEETRNVFQFALKYQWIQA